MIVVTGGAGFIGSALVWRLNQLGKSEIIIVDRLGATEKWKNLVGLSYADIYHKDDFIDMVIGDQVPFQIDAILHLGACSSTTEKDADYLLHNNYKYSQALAEYSLEKDIRFIYASSAATYGDGSNGYDDNVKLESLEPLNMYGYSKHMFDLWAQNEGITDQIVGLKYFNVFGPNEYHKDDMRSVVHKAFAQIKETCKVKLFKSYNEQYEDGKQMRDFIYVKDAVDMTLHFLENRDKNGLFNVGTGKANSWIDLVTPIFNAMELEPNIEFIDMPENLRGKYQYFTEAKIEKIRNAGFTKSITNIDEAVTDYVKNYLMKEKQL